MKQYHVYPEKDEDSAIYWQSIRQCKMKLQKCDSCGKFRFPPSPSCYYCGTNYYQWLLVSGKGRVYSWATVHHPVDSRLASEVPFVISMVELEEGPHLAGRLINVPRELIKVGMPVRIRYDIVDDNLTMANFEATDLD